MINRRSLFFGALAAPAVVRAESLMPIYVPPLILTGNLSVCEAAIIEAAWAGKRVLDRNGRLVGREVMNQRFAIGRPLTVPERPPGVWCGLGNCDIWSLRIEDRGLGTRRLPDMWAGDDGVWRVGAHHLLAGRA